MNFSRLKFYGILILPLTFNKGICYQLLGFAGQMTRTCQQELPRFANWIGHFLPAIAAALRFSPKWKLNVSGRVFFRKPVWCRGIFMLTCLPTWSNVASVIVSPRTYFWPPNKTQNILIHNKGRLQKKKVKLGLLAEPRLRPARPPKLGPCY